MKIKINEVKRIDEPFTLGDGKITGYPYAVTLEGSGEVVKIVTYTKSIEVNPGAEFEEGVNVKEIKKENKEYQGKKYIQYTLKALPKEGFSKGGYSKTMQKVTKTQYGEFISFAHQEAVKLAGDDKGLIQGYFQTILNNLVKGVEPFGDIKAEDKPPKAIFENPFSDEDVPF